MRSCVICGDPRVEWHHAISKYSGRQINEAWAILPACYTHHRGSGFDPRLMELIALRRATAIDLAKYPKRDWEQLRAFLEAKYKAY